MHYMKFGHKEGRNPGPNFDTARYAAMYPEAANAGIVPLLHYLDHARSSAGAGAAAASPSAVRHEIVKSFAIVPGAEVAVLVSHSASGRLKPHVLPYMRLLSDQGIAVVLVAVVDRPLELLDAEIAVAAGIIVRENAGYDFGAWAHALEIEPLLYGAGLLVLANDSVIPTAEASVFAEMISRVRNCPADIVALTASHEYGWHVQSYFMALRPRALSSWAFQHWMRGIERLEDKDAVIRAYEVPFATRMQAAGLSVHALYPSSLSANPTFFGWRELIGKGFPFVKLLILREQFAAAVPDYLDVLEDINQHWPEVLAAAGFDVDLVRTTIRAADVTPPGIADARLLMHVPAFPAAIGQPALRVAFFGPWNYDSDLGAASRNVIAALRRTGARLNLHPIERPFHSDRRLCPAVPLCDFGGQADVAVVHLNPDSWHLLTPEQGQLIAGAKHRIGYWAWATDTLPEDWLRHRGLVDRIWAPSRYCAEIFATQAHLPVDVVPLAVVTSKPAALEREGILTRFGLPVDGWVILHVFDGASHLARKGLPALIHAFAAAQLGPRGWTLLLKTQYPFDQPEAAVALAELVAAVPHVVFVDGHLHARETVELIAAADIYASPHSSEGVGLVVAEAMAAGKPVVVTDFGGSRDVVDATCGYPVAWTLQMLDADLGRHRKGHGWASVDEAELTRMLAAAAQTVERGDASIGEAARIRIVRDRSYDAVASSIVRSFDLMIRGEGIEGESRGSRPQPPPPPQPLAISVTHGTPFAMIPPAHGIYPVALQEDLRWQGSWLPATGDGDWLVFAPGGARAAPGLVDLIRKAIHDRPDAVLFYGDDVATIASLRDQVRFKPDFDRTLLLAQDYIGAPVIVRRAALDAIGGIDAGRGTAAVYDLVLRLAAAGHTITRIPQVLLGFSGERPVATQADRAVALEAQGLPRGARIAAGLAPGLLRLCWPDTTDYAPHVTICIPTCRSVRPQGGTHIEALLAALADVAWPMNRLSVIVGDDMVESPNWEASDRPYALQRIPTPRAPGELFNYAAKMNRLSRVATGDIVVMMNDDVLPHGRDWLKALVGFAAQPDVGGVGARLLYADGALQHVGIYPAFGTVVHAWLGMDPAAPTAHHWALAQREWSMVTGAVFALRRSVLAEVAGFDEAFSLEFNDIDLCLRIRNLGYRIVSNPDAVFTHAEKASRGDALPPGGEVALFLSRWGRWLAQDPASHPCFARDRVDLVPAPAPDAWYLAAES
ncbi:GT2 family glycosyltransferase/glycosyltransferase involved in cell wall biosynthesis [Novosphingobium sp. 1529]